MASIRKEVVIDAEPAAVWSALRDFGALHERLAPGFVVDTQLEGDERTVTFFNGAVARELLVATDDDARRLAYSIVDGPLPITHHNASAQVLDESDGRSRFVWIADVLPDDVAATMSGLMERGTAAAKKALEKLTEAGTST